MRSKTGPSGVCTLLACFLALAAGGTRAEPAVSLFPSVGRTDAVRVQGRVLAEQPHHAQSSLGRNLRRFTASAAVGMPVQLSVNGTEATAITDEHGEFQAELRFTESPPGIYPVTAHVPGATGHGAVQLIDASAPFLLISDLDDTLSVTHVLDKTKLLKAALLEDSDTQPVVPGMAAFYRCLMADKKAAPALAVVTGTPIEYGTRTVAFLAQHDFPFAALYPRVLGLKTMEGYKQPVIRDLFKQLPQKAICVGDSGEHDPEVYRQMNQEFPGRILQTYIRDVGRDEDPKRFEGQFVFKDAGEAAAHAVAHGWMTQACFEAAFPGGKAR